MSNPCFCIPSKPPQEVKAGGNSGKKYGMLLDMQTQPNAFQTNLCDAPCASPLKCCVSCLFPNCTAAPWREAALNQYGHGIEDYVCCQGYIPGCCCCKFETMGRGSAACMWLEGCCCAGLSMSITRIYVMQAKQLHPDPVDYQVFFYFAWSAPAAHS
mmetsp:Transcript_51723/g.117809  ORF Transcript_51723/g.117809 Transcript_51723/m.117809 type:complete len:157 (+) Transcript_51723:64-534(+)